MRPCYSGATGSHVISPSLAWKWGRPWWDARRSLYGRKPPHWSVTGQGVGATEGYSSVGLASEWHCESRSGTISCASRASIVVTLISTSGEAVLLDTLQQLPGFSFTSETSNCFSSTCRRINEQQRKSGG